MSKHNDNAKKLVVDYPLTVHTYDVDFIGHVNNVVYIRWLEELRVRFLEVHYPLEEMVGENFAPVITKTNIHYKRAVNLFDKPVGRVWLDALGLATFTLGHEILLDGEVMASATQKGCFVDLETSKVIRVPEGLVQKYQDEA